MLVLPVFLLSLLVVDAQDSLLIFGGNYPDDWSPDDPGPEINKTEVWSPFGDCSIKIGDNPYSFEWPPGAAFLDDKFYVCGGHGREPTEDMNKCYTYNVVTGVWSQGPSMKFSATSYPTGNELMLATVGSSIVAVFRQSAGMMMMMSTLQDTEWSEPIALGAFSGNELWNMFALDEKHFALLIISKFDIPYHQYVEIVDVETGTHIAEYATETECLNAFLYNEKFTCMKRGDGVFGVSELWYITFNEDFGEPTWSLAYDLPDYIFNINYRVFYSNMMVLDGMLTSVWEKEALVAYLVGDEWVLEDLETPRNKANMVVAPCNIL